MGLLPDGMFKRGPEAVGTDCACAVLDEGEDWRAVLPVGGARSVATVRSWPTDADEPADEPALEDDDEDEVNGHIICSDVMNATNDDP